MSFNSKWFISDIHWISTGEKPNPKPNPIPNPKPKPKTVGEKPSPNPKPQDPKPAGIRPEPDPLPSLLTSQPLCNTAIVRVLETIESLCVYIYIRSGVLVLDGTTLIGSGARTACFLTRHRVVPTLLPALPSRSPCSDGVHQHVCARECHMVKSVLLQHM
jgi:hypothetical protein